MVFMDNSTPHRAAAYDTEILKTIPYYNTFHAETIDLAGAVCPAPKVWLDTGCGTGTLAEKAMASFPETLFILSDPSEAMLETAKMRFAGNDRVVFLEPSATEDLSEDIGFKPDIITAIQAHHYLSPPGRRRATEVCFDLLQPGGLFVTFENVAPFSGSGIDIVRQRWGGFQLSRGRTHTQVDSHLARYGKEYLPITVEEHLALYRGCGFSTVELLWYSCMQAGFYCIK
jgi:tRNA (cmo5U34)-methyltransferase